MAYLRCESCGAKALVAASRCPRCANEFHLVDARGERVKLVGCRGCGIMHRKGAACHWCPPASARAWPSRTVIQSAAATLLFAVIGASTWTYGARVPDLLSQALSRSTPASLAAPVIAPLEGSPTVGGSAVVAASDIERTGPVAPQPTDTTPVAVVASAADSITWVPAVARTWVNIRNESGRSGDVVGVIKPASRAMLGATGRAGWRQVRSGDTTGWVDSRLFEADSLASRG